MLKASPILWSLLQIFQRVLNILFLKYITARVLNAILEECTLGYLCSQITRKSPAVEGERILFDPIIWSINEWMKTTFFAFYHYLPHQAILKWMRINYITILWSSYYSHFTGREIRRQRDHHLGGAGSKESSAAPASRTIILQHQSPSLSISHSSRVHHSMTPTCECLPPMSYLRICHNGPHPQLTVGRHLLKAGAAAISILSWPASLCLIKIFVPWI